MVPSAVPYGAMIGQGRRLSAGPAERLVTFAGVSNPCDAGSTPAHSSRLPRVHIDGPVPAHHFRPLSVLAPSDRERVNTVARTHIAHGLVVCQCVRTTFYPLPPIRRLKGQLRGLSEMCARHMASMSLAQFCGCASRALPSSHACSRPRDVKAALAGLSAGTLRLCYPTPSGRASGTFQA